MNVIAKHMDMPIAVIGDVHGKWGLIRDKIKYYNLENVLVFQTGDFGVGFNYNDPREPKKERKRLLELNAFLKKRNICLYVIHGNHDNPVFFDGNHNFTNLIFMQDYDVVEVGEHRILGIGGATSIDRKPNHHFKDYMGYNYPGRREGVNWWPGAEKIVYDEEKLATIAGVDVVITHTAPDFVYPPVLGQTIYKWCDCDPGLKAELIVERELVTKIYKKLDEINVIKFWFYGHFHRTNTQKHELTKFCLLDIGEIQEIKFEREEEYE
jgi:UDP-2,3-diacylglucosamine pyrophosphatase LpxH